MSREISELTAGVVGTGFIGVAHVDVARGEPADEPEYPTFRDGHVENVLADAVAASNRVQP